MSDIRIIHYNPSHLLTAKAWCGTGRWGVRIVMNTRGKPTEKKHIHSREISPVNCYRCLLLLKHGSRIGRLLAILDPIMLRI